MADLRAQSLLSVANRGRTCHGPQAQQRKTAVPRAAAANWQFRQLRPQIQQAHFVLDGGARVVVQRTLCDVDLGGMPCLPIRRSQQSGGSGCTPAFVRAHPPMAAVGLRKARAFSTTEHAHPPMAAIRPCAA